MPHVARARDSANSGSQPKPATKIFRWLRQVARDHVNLEKIALTYAIWLSQYLGASGIAYLDQFSQATILGMSDRHFRRGRKELLDRGHLVEAGRTRAGNVFDRIVMRPDILCPADNGCPADKGSPVEPDKGCPTESLDESLYPHSQSKLTRIAENFWPNDRAHRIAKELFGEAADNEIKLFRAFQLKEGRAKRDWNLECEVWLRRQFSARRGQQSFAFSFSNNQPRPKAGTSIMPPAEKGAIAAATGKFYACFGSPQLDAWEEHSKRIGGRGYARDRDGGWWFESEWPPDRDERQAS